MNCKQAVTQIEAYLDNRLETIIKEEFLKHLEICNKCNRQMLEKKELYFYLSVQSSKKPEYTILTDGIMDEIYKLKSGNDDKTVQKANGLFFRRIGFSMVLAAFVMVLSFFLPAGRLNILDNSVRAETNNKVEKQIYINNAFSKIDNKIKSFIDSIDFNF